MKTFVGAKIHDIRVTQKSVEYFGSVTLPLDLMVAAGIDAYEQVHVINLTNGKRWITYALPGDHGEFSLNGGGARLGEVGDRCVILTYQQADIFKDARVVFCNEHNAVRVASTYLSMTIEPGTENPLPPLVEVEQ